MFTLYSADIIGNPSNCSYPNKTEVTDVDSLRAAVCHDYVCAEYKNNYRSGDNFLGADCLPVDCDNDHSEDPVDWVMPADVAAAFPDVRFAVHYSRYNMREKNGKPARPKFHILFPITHMTDAVAYSDMKKLVNSIFPYFDNKALDAARFFFGTTKAEKAKAEGASVKVLGSGCAKCNQLEAATKAALEQLGMDATIDHVTDFAQIATYGVMTTPALVVDGKVVSYGKVLKTDEVVKILQRVRG